MPSRAQTFGRPRVGRTSERVMKIAAGGGEMSTIVDLREPPRMRTSDIQPLPGFLSRTG